MIKIVFLSAAFAIGAVGVASAGPSAITPHAKMIHKTAKKTITASGRCGGVSYGTGARRCGSRSGGPSGGLSSKN